MPPDSKAFESSFEEWQIGACQFRCDICSKVFASSVVFWHHVKEAHALSKQDYTRLHGKGIIHEETIFCQLCESDVLHDFGSLKGHFRRSHDDLDLKTYFQEHVVRRGNEKVSGVRDVFTGPNRTPPLATRSKQSQIPAHKSVSAQSRQFASPSSANRTPASQAKFDSPTDKSELTFIAETSAEPIKSPSTSPAEKETKKPNHSLLYPWLNRCTYQCILCQLELNSKAKINRHVLEKHNMSMNDYKKQYGGCRTAVEYHECSKCGDEVINEADDVRKHLDTHQMTMPEYQKFMDKKEKQKTQAKFKQVKSNELKESIGKKDVQEGTIEKSTSSEGRNEVHNPVKQEYPWLGKCTFQCNICRYLTYAKTNLNRHVLKDHGLRIEEYRQVHGDGMLVKSYHQCRQCGLGLLNERDDVRQHLLTEHKSTVLAYHTKYMIQGVVPPPVSQPETPIEKQSYDWMNKCTYACKMCDYTCSRKSTFGNHTIRKHGVNTKEYRAQYGEFRTTTVYHKCHYCKKDVINDMETLSNHVNTHKSTIHAYHQKFMEKKKPPARKLPAAPKVQKYPWMNTCTYRCKICSWTTRWRRAFGGHTKRLHDLTEQKYKKLFPGDIRIVTKHLKCQLCEKDLVNDYEDWKKHLPQHEETVESYHQRFYADRSEVETVGIAPCGLPLASREEIVEFFSDEGNRAETLRFIRDNAAAPAKKGILLRFIWTTCFTDAIASNILWPSTRRNSLTYDETLSYMPDEFVTFFGDLVSSLRAKEEADSSWQLEAQCDVERVRNYLYGLRGNAKARKRRLGDEQKTELDSAPMPKKVKRQERAATANINERCLSGEESTTDEDDSGLGSSASNDFAKAKNSDSKDVRKCRNCSVTSSPMWRKDDQGNYSLCNACGIHYKLHGNNRTVKDNRMNKDLRVVPDHSDVSSNNDDSLQQEQKFEGRSGYTVIPYDDVMKQEEKLKEEYCLDISTIKFESNLIEDAVVKSDSEDDWIYESDSE